MDRDRRHRDLGANPKEVRADELFRRLRGAETCALRRRRRQREWGERVGVVVWLLAGHADDLRRLDVFHEVQRTSRYIVDGSQTVAVSLPSHSAAGEERRARAEAARSAAGAAVAVADEAEGTAAAVKCWHNSRSIISVMCGPAGLGAPHDHEQFRS